MDGWIKWPELNNLLHEKGVVFFGAAIDIVEKTLNKLKRKPDLILDNSAVMQGSDIFGIKIEHPEKIHGLKNNCIVLITSTSYLEIGRQLEQMGLIKGKDYFISPVILSQKIELEIKNVDQSLIFTCSDGVEMASKDSGGGLYTYNTRTRELVKHFDGRLRQIALTKDYFYIADAVKGVRIFDHDLQLVDTIEGLPGTVMHGVACDEANGLLFTANTGRDSVSIIDLKSGKYIEEIFISHPNREGESDRHHINDLCFYKGKLYISMFSFSGLWKQECFDGGVAQLDLETGKITSYPIINLWMPHSIDFIDDEIMIIDSMRGNVFKTSNKILVTISGFLRGLTFDGKYFYIGQSEHRHYDRLKDTTNMISVNAGIHIYHPETKACRFHSFERISNIHSLAVFDIPNK